MDAREPPPLPPKPPVLEKPRGSWLAIILLASGGLAAAVVLTFLTLGFFGPILLLGLAVFGVIGLQYLVWGWLFERIYRSRPHADSPGPCDDSRPNTAMAERAISRADETSSSDFAPPVA